MNLQKIFLSKLIKVCNIDWIADSDALYGEKDFTLNIPREHFKKLVYRHEGLESMQTRLLTRNSLHKTHNKNLARRLQSYILKD